MKLRPLFLSLIIVPSLLGNNLADLDKNLLESAKSMKLESVEEALTTYERMRNFDMVNALAEILVTRDATNAIGLKYSTPSTRKALEKAAMPAEPESPEPVPSEAPETVAGDKFDAALEKKDWSAALAAAESWDAQMPSNLQTAMWRAQVQLGQEKSAEALATLDAAKGSGRLPSDGSAEMLRAYCLTALERPAEAKELLATITQSPSKYSKELVTEAKTLENEMKLAASQSAADQALDRKDVSQARQAIKEFAEAQGDADEVALLESRADLLEGNHTAALEKLSQVKRKYNARPFPAQMDLAGAYLATGNYTEASAALDEIVSQEGYDAAAKKDAKGQLRDLFCENTSGLQVDSLFFTADEGTAYYARGIYRTNWEKGRRWQLWSRLDDISLTKSESYVTDTSHTGYEGGVKVNQVSGDLLFSGSLGATDGYPILGAGVGSRGQSGLRWNLESGFNEIVTSSLQLQSVNARQHRLTLAIEKQLAPQLYFDLTAQGRYVHLDYAEFGMGIGAEYSLLYNALSCKEGEPILRLGYLGNVQRFNGKTSDELAAVTFSDLPKDELANLPENLMEKNINQHGLLVELNGRMGGKTNWSLAGAALYDTFDERFEYIGRANVNCWVTEACRLSVGLEYLSAGQGANSGGSIITGTAGVVMAF